MKQKDPEAEARRRERSRREATFPRCKFDGCGNVAGVGQTYCGAHRPVIEQEELQADEFARIRSDIANGLHGQALSRLTSIVERLL